MAMLNSQMVETSCEIKNVRNILMAVTPAMSQSKHLDVSLPAAHWCSLIRGWPLKFEQKQSFEEHPATNQQNQSTRSNQHFWTLPNHPEREAGHIMEHLFLQFPAKNGPVLQHPSRPKREAIFRSCLVITSLSSATNRTGLVSFHVIPRMESKDMNMAQAGPRHMPFSNHQRNP